MSGGGGGASAAGNGSNLIRCFLRCRPPSSEERQSPEYSSCVTLNTDQGRVSIRKDFEEKHFTFNGVFGGDSTQEEVYEKVARDVLDDVFKGFATTIFCYGQTGTGKTFTLSELGDHNTMGIIPRAVTEIFQRVETDQEHDYVIRMQMIQIYMEMIQDLLNPESKNMQIREDPESGVFLSGVDTQRVVSAEDCLRKYTAGNDNRVVALTDMNAQSSRSHSCLILLVEKRQRISRQDLESAEFSSDKSVNTSRSVVYGKLTLVDLAGSERVKKTGVTGARLNEAKTINLSLSALGNVVHALTDSRSKHIPFRDSKLTRLLQDSLGGNGKTSIVVTIGPAAFNAHETYSTILFGQRAMKVEQHAKINESIDYKAMCIKLQAQVDDLEDKNRELMLQFEALADQVRSLDPTGSVSDPVQVLRDMRKAHELEKEGIRAMVEGDTAVAMEVYEAEIEKLHEQMAEMKVKLEECGNQSSVDMHMEDLMLDLETEKEELRNEVESTKADLEIVTAERDQLRRDLDDALNQIRRADEENTLRVQEFMEENQELRDSVNRLKSDTSSTFRGLVGVQEESPTKSMTKVVQAQEGGRRRRFSIVAFGDKQPEVAKPEVDPLAEEDDRSTRFQIRDVLGDLVTRITDTFEELPSFSLLNPRKSTYVDDGSVEAQVRSKLKELVLDRFCDREWAEMEEELADLVCGVDDVDPQTASAFLSSVDNTMLDVEVTLPRKAWEEFYTLKKSTEENPEPGVPDMNLVLPVKGVMMGREARADTLSQHLWTVTRLLAVRSSHYIDEGVQNLQEVEKERDLAVVRSFEKCWGRLASHRGTEEDPEVRTGAALLEQIEEEGDETKWRWLAPLLAYLCESLQSADALCEGLLLSLARVRAQRDAQSHLLGALSTFIVDSGDCIRRLSEESLEMTETLNHVLDELNDLRENFESFKKDVRKKEKEIRKSSAEDQRRDWAARVIQRAFHRIKRQHQSARQSLNMMRLRAEAERQRRQTLLLEQERQVFEQQMSAQTGRILLTRSITELDNLFRILLDFFLNEKSEIFEEYMSMFNPGSRNRSGSRTRRGTITGRQPVATGARKSTVSLRQQSRQGAAAGSSSQSGAAGTGGAAAAAAASLFQDEDMIMNPMMQFRNANSRK